MTCGADGTDEDPGAEPRSDRNYDLQSEPHDEHRAAKKERNRAGMCQALRVLLDDKGRNHNRGERPQSDAGAAFDERRSEERQHSQQEEEARADG